MSRIDAITEKARHGMRIAIRSYAHVTSSERVLICYSNELVDESNRVLLHSFTAEASRCSNEAVLVEAQEFDALSLAEFDVVLLVSRTQSVFRRQLIGYLEKYPDSIRAYRFFNFSVPLFELAMQIPQGELDAMNDLVIRAARQVGELRIASRHGTDLRVGLGQHDSPWTNSCGMHVGSFPGVLPPGEVNTYSDDVSGSLIVDGALNSSFGYPGSPVLKSPLTVEFEDSRVISTSCSDEILSQVLRSFLTVPNAERVGEVGLGTNWTIDKWVSTVGHINERRAGFHLGLGTPSQYVDWSCPLHLDLIVDDCEIEFGGTRVFQNGCWDRQALNALCVGDAKSSPVLHVDAL